MKYPAILFIPALLTAAEQPKTVSIAGPRTVTVSERSVVPIYVCQFQETLLILPATEKVMKAFIADTKNWKLESGRDDQASRYLSIKVGEPLTRETTLNVVSDHEANYTFKLSLNEEHCDSKVSIDADSQLAAEIQKTEPWVSPAEAAKLSSKSTTPGTMLQRRSRKHERKWMPTARVIPRSCISITSGTPRPRRSWACTPSGMTIALLTFPRPRKKRRRSTS